MPSLFGMGADPEGDASVSAVPPEHQALSRSDYVG